LPRKLNVPVEAQIRLARARNAVKLGDLALAITEFEQYLALAPADAAVREEFAGVLTQAERYAAAVASYQELMRIAPTNTSRYLIALSDLLVRMKDFRNAIVALHQAIELIPDTPATAPQRLDAAARLARVHLLDENLPAAFDVIQKYLAILKPGDEAVPIRFVSLLLDLERAREAQPFLEPFVNALGDSPDSEVLVNNVRMLALLNEKRKAFDAIEQLGAKIPTNVSARLQLIGNLVAQEDFDLAAILFGQIAQIRPNHVPTQIAQVGMLIRQFRLPQAKMVLENLKPVTSDQILEASLMRGEYHLAAGQYIEAKYFYLDILRQFPNDPDARLGLAATHEAAHDLEKAKAEYSKIPAQSRGGRRARRGLASVYAAQRKIAQALDVLICLHKEAPWDHQTVVLYMKIMTRNGGAAQAASFAEGYLAGGSPTASAAAAVEGELGHCLLVANKVAEAEAAYRSALAMSYNKSLAGHYGLNRVNQRLGGNYVDMGCPPEFAGDEIRFRIVMSDLYADDWDDKHAFDHAFVAMRAEPQNLAVLIRVADIQQRLARESGLIDDALATAKTLLIVSPTNVRGHLTLARTYAIGQNYKGAIEVYQKLISLDVDYTLPKRELARMYYTDHRYDLSHDTYNSIALGAPDVFFRTALQTISDRAPGAAPVVQLMTGSRAQLPGFGPELTRIANMQTDPIVGQSIMSALADYEARVDEAKGAQLEDVAKSLKGFRDRSAVGAYRALVEQEPANADGLFDFAQVYATLKDTHQANQVYNDLLAVDPLSRESKIALDRDNAEMSPSFRTWISYDNEFGFNNLANVGRFRLGELVTLPLGDQDEYFGFGYTRVNYQAPGGPGLDGNIASLILQKRIPGSDELLWRSVLNYEDYANRIPSRPTGEFGVIDTGDCYTISAKAYLENVIENSESINQGIFRFGGVLTGEYEFNRRIDVGGLYRYAYYSDVNNMEEFNLHASYKFTYLPMQLRMIFNVNGLFYTSPTVFGPGGQNNLVGTIHPYFAPENYTFYETSLEWTHILGRDLFVGADNFKYIATYGLGCDNSFNSYNRFRIDMNWDCKSWLTFGLSGQYIYSPVYRYGSIMAYLSLRLPHLYHL
jgi:tetratricopeptide (TPR) repeat protein